MQKLVIEAQTDRDKAAQLWQQVQRYAFKVACKYKGLAEIDDLKQEAFLGYSAAVQSYNPDKGDFLPYMGRIVSQRISRYITSNNTGAAIPEYLKRQSAQLKHYREEFYKENGRTPKDEEAAAALNMSAEKIRNLENISLLLTAASIEKPLVEDLTLGDVIPDAEDRITDTIEDTDRAQIGRELAEALQDTDGGEVLYLLFVEQLSTRRAAAETGRTFTQINRDKSRALKQIRRGAHRHKLKAYFDEYLKTNYYTGSGLTRFLQRDESIVEHIALKSLGA